MNAGLPIAYDSLPNPSDGLPIPYFQLGACFLALRKPRRDTMCRSSALRAVHKIYVLTHLEDECVSSNPLPIHVEELKHRSKRDSHLDAKLGGPITWCSISDAIIAESLPKSNRSHVLLSTHIGVTPINNS